jgi:hypothetical protein
MGAAPYIPIVDRSAETDLMAEIDLQDIQDARRDPAVHQLLKDAAAEGQRVEREGRQRWQ